MKTIIAWFSCGAASAVATKLCLEQYSTDKVVVARCVVANEHPDNERFAKDCEDWFRVKIIKQSSTKYADCWEVWEKKRFLVGPKGAPCTGAMKKDVRKIFEQHYQPTAQVFGFTVEEQNRAKRFCQNNPEINLITPLIDRHINKAECLTIIQNAGIELPVMYRLGFNNNNCIGCVKGGMGYWNHIRKHFPDVFERMACLERNLGATIIRKNGLPLYLDQLNPSAGRHQIPKINRSLCCFQNNPYRAEVI